MLVVRSIAFNVAFYAVTIVMMVLGLPMLATRRGVVRLAQAWGRVCLWLLAAIAGTRLEVRGREHLPPGGALIAAKHQSALETFALVTLLDDPVYILKRELIWLPLFGWYLQRARMVAIDRRAGPRALPLMNARAGQEVADGRQLIIFPEGTRRPPGAPPAYKQGVAHLYAALRAPCVPVALNAGLFWPRRSFLRRPGTAIIAFLPAIPADLPRDAFFETLRERIEAASDALLGEGAAPAAARPAAA